MSNAKEYIITETRHEIYKYTYIIEAENKEEAMDKFLNYPGTPCDDPEYIDCTSSTIEIEYETTRHGL